MYNVSIFILFLRLGNCVIATNKSNFFYRKKYSIYSICFNYKSRI